MTWERTAPEPADVEPAAGWFPDGEPAGAARLTYAPPNSDLPGSQPAYREPAYVEPPDLEPAAAGAWLVDPAPEDPQSAGFQAATANAWAGYVDPADGDSEAPESVGFEPATADAWPSGPQPGADEPDAPERVHFDGGALDAWPEGRQPGADKPDAPERTRSDRDTPDPWPGGPQSGGFDLWSEDPRPDDTEFDAPDPAGFEPVADEEFCDGGPGGARPADTWFTGVGPADSRFAHGSPAGPRPAEAERDDPRRLGSPEQRGSLGPGQGRRSQRPGPAWSEYPPDGFPGQSWPAGGGRVPLGAPVALDPRAPESLNLTERFSAAEPDGGSPGWVGGAPFSEPDELFRAWQGSVNEAAAGRGHWSVPRRAVSASRRRRALQAAAIGVPVVVIVTVGAGALMMLTGKANDMLAVRADTGAGSPTATGTSGTHAAARPTAGAVPPAFVSAALSGYPGQRGTVTVASMMAAAGATVAVGTADGHPAIWSRASNGSWTLESAATVSAVSGSAELASVTHGPAGWIAVGTTSDARTTEPVVLASADGVRWQPVTSLAAQAGMGTEFLGAAAGRSGYVVVGRQMVGGRAFAVLWYSPDLRSWTSDDNDGLDGRLAASTANAITATADGFVAVGSHGADQSMWVSTDGRHWSIASVPTPAGAASATLSSVVASGTRVVAGGYAATRSGDIPVVVVSADGGAQWRQIVLQAPDGLGMITALTATPNGFTAAGVVGPGDSQHAVIWTSPDGLTWSRPAQTAGGEITALAVAGTVVTGTAEQGTTPTLVALPAP